MYYAYLNTISNPSSAPRISTKQTDQIFYFYYNKYLHFCISLYSYRHLF